MVTRWCHSTDEVVNGKPVMRPNGCTVRAPAHGWEIISVDGRDFCLGCVRDAAREQTGTVHNSWFYTGSPHGADILALGAPELKEPA